MMQRLGSILLTFALCSTLLSSFGYAFGPSTEENRYVKTFSDFKIYVESHRLRVRELGITHYKLHPDRYKDLPQKTVEKYLALHDRSKQEESNARALYAYYGRNQKFMPEQLRESFVKVINHINTYDSKVAEKFVSENPLTGSQIERLFEIEKIADLVDRGMDPVAREDFEEGGRYTMKLGSEFLLHEFSKGAARHLEKIYSVLTKGQSFVERKNALASMCRGMF